jgi:hypothetical protein
MPVHHVSSASGWQTLPGEPVQRYCCGYLKYRKSGGSAKPSAKSSASVAPPIVNLVIDSVRNEAVHRPARSDNSGEF